MEWQCRFNRFICWRAVTHLSNKLHEICKICNASRVKEKLRIGIESQFGKEPKYYNNKINITFQLYNGREWDSKSSIGTL